ncbi:DUF2793 domain-containing protein, partial [Altererythrobacter sp.]|nr:DUF2793 domain-containing protein [Altererythrobacter sp.]
MALPLSFESASARHRLPLLFAGQAQKEIVVNEALARIDSLLQPSAEGVRDDAPAAPSAGETWIVGIDAAGSWAGKSNSLATYSAGDWLYCEPVSGMRCYIRSAGAFATFTDR